MKSLVKNRKLGVIITIVITIIISSITCMINSKAESSIDEVALSEILDSNENEICGEVSYLSSSKIDTAHSHTWSSWKHNSECHWKYCDGCKKYKNVEYHKLYEYKRVNATCTKNGYVLYKCKCGYKCKKTLKAEKVHKYDSGKIVLNATCCQKGIKQYTCINCGKVKKVYLAPIDTHRYDNGVITKAPTCSQEGIKTYTCKDCGKKYTVSLAATGNHTYGTGYVYRKATCSQEGINAYPCKNCDHIYYQYTAKTDHLYDSGVITKVSTCTQNGIITYTCKECGKKVNYEIKANGSHYCERYSANETYHWKKCAYCSTEYDIQAHNFDGGTILKNATETSEGLMAYKCTICGYQKYQTIPKKVQVLQALGKLELSVGKEEYLFSKEIIFVLRFQGVEYIDGLNVYVDDTKISSENVIEIKRDGNTIIYKAKVEWNGIGMKSLRVDANNCSSASAYFYVQ